MKIILFASIVLLFACKETITNHNNEAIDNPKGNKEIEIKIEGMSCEGCENTIQSKVSKLDGIISVKASHANGNAIVNCDSVLVDTSAIRKTVTASGYTIISISNYQK